MVGAALGFGEDVCIVVGNIGWNLLLYFSGLAMTVWDVGEVGL